uniref:EOG090X0DP2 n=1 Tax=Moina brachiata TaxID=675436 RepID=A0A4Y7NLZ5_9CRUS|nr:EOG090X0DP2 [Moina brachiata]SVE93265.1 EOG090X0DP2 [Moina brachiata]
MHLAFVNMHNFVGHFSRTRIFMPDTIVIPSFRGLICRTTARVLICWAISKVCVLVSYRKVFEQYATILQQKYPSLMVSGENHPPPYYKMRMAQVLGALKMLLIIAVVAGTNIFEYLGLQTPSVWEWTQQNKFYSCLMTFFLCNAIEGQLVSTGAFEISLNDVPLWSKLETGRIPQPPELFQMIDNHLNMAGPQLSFDS